MKKMIPVAEAVAILVEHGRQAARAGVRARLGEAAGMRLAEPVVAQVFQPPANVSAMDGYAVRFDDMATGAQLRVIGESRAGAPFVGDIGHGECVRVFTGAFTPPACDHILIQEDARQNGAGVEITTPQSKPSSVRRRGRDFQSGDILVPAGHLMTAGAIALSAAGNVGEVVVHPRPRVGVLANGDELAPAGACLTTGQVVNSIAPALLQLLKDWGAEPVDLGVARDDISDVRAKIERDVDIVVSIGGASVGDFDVVRPAFAQSAFAPVFEKVAVKPGKPTWFSAREGRLALGLPGNPAAAMVTARLFLRPLLDAISGVELPAAVARARTTKALLAAEKREEYLRAVLTVGDDGVARITPAEDQDSSLLSPFLVANALIMRPAGEPAAMEGDLVPYVAM